VTHTLDPEQVERLITPRTTGIMGVHLWGRACNVEALEEIARRRNLKLLYDAAHAFACSHNGTMIGNFGDAEVFSFHATKFLNSYEGGAVVTNDDELATKIRLMKNFGFSGYDNVTYIGTNGKMNEMSAAMGITSMESMDQFIAVNRENYEHYRRELNGIPGIQLMEYNSRDKNNYHYIVVEVDEEVTGISRDRLVEVLHAENVIARRYFFPGCHQMEPYRSYFPNAGLMLPQTIRLSNRILCLPNGEVLGAQEIATICDIIRLAANKAAVPQTTERVAVAA
jgi:dTDP-4-amino-4,6-dideoxygalactose transaminase